MDRNISDLVRQGTQTMMAAIIMVYFYFVGSALSIRSGVRIWGTTVGPGLKIPSGKRKWDALY